MRRPLASALALLVAAPALAPPAAAQDLFAIRKNFGLFAEIYEQLATEYVDPIDAERLMRAGIAAMTETLDPYTVFYDEATATEGRLQQSDEAGGVGMAVAERGGALVVVGLIEGGAAEAQGVRVGDRLVRLAGRETAGLAEGTARELLRGEPGSTVAVEMAREGEPAPLRFALARARPSRRDVTHAALVADGVAYVRLAQFLGQSSRELRGALDTLRAEADGAGAPLRAVVLDLRGNGGGLVREAVDVTGVFVPRGTPVVSTRGRAAGTETGYRTADTPLVPELPVAVLVDAASASASEIVAGALQDHDRAVVVGEPTFGKGLVQVVRPMPYGTALKVTVSRYYTPSGRTIERPGDAPRAGAAAPPRPTFETAAGRTVRGGGGIDPDVAVGLGPESELERALVRAAAFLRFANRYRADHPSLPAGWDVDADLLADFRRFAESEGVAYRTDAERELDALAASLDAAGYGDAADELAALRRAVEAEKAGDFARHAPRLGARLRQEVLARYLGRADLTRTLLDGDPVLDAALALLADEARYRETLGG